MNETEWYRATRRQDKTGDGIQNSIDRAHPPHTQPHLQAEDGVPGCVFPCTSSASSKSAALTASVAGAGAEPDASVAAGARAGAGGALRECAGVDTSDTALVGVAEPPGVRVVGVPERHRQSKQPTTGQHKRAHEEGERGAGRPEALEPTNFQVTVRVSASATRAAQQQQHSARHTTGTSAKNDAEPTHSWLSLVQLTTSPTIPDTSATAPQIERSRLVAHRIWRPTQGTNHVKRDETEREHASGLTTMSVVRTSSSTLSPDAAHSRSS